MMNLYTKTALCSVLIIAISSFIPYTLRAPLAATRSKSVVDLYFSSLFSGDIETVKQCLGKGLIERHKNTFKDQTYSNFLINRYDGATYRVVQKRERENGKKTFDVEITFKDNSTMTIRLLLNQSNQIIDEIVL